ncbi:hypothetical protein K469DRAFT_547808 [Zopfia rhizophila CBS 207.26]|uniref:C2H2-type domain-containing protein n=1 Tax=Zopfia rhizophila CBS 207.26 TaxID=1314779 RepID=A0A6A6EUN4_9PEZI|nr:hypothetical protein K469DRAFT_547808 [Zopfia rhizophila CBS 207.26]
MLIQLWHSPWSCPKARAYLKQWPAHPLALLQSHRNPAVSQILSPPTLVNVYSLAATRRKVPDTSAAGRKTMSSRNLHPPPYTRPTPDSNSDLNFDSGSDSYSDSYTDPDTEPDTNPDTEPDTESDTESDIGLDANPGMDSDLESCLDSEAEEILRDIAQLEEEGPAKPRQKPQTVKLWKREGELWVRFCLKIEVDPEDSLRECKRGRFKAYLRWRKKHFRINKQSSMEVYWKRLSQCYRDLTRHKMDGDVLDDVHNWIPSLKLDTSKKEKHAMYVQDLYAILHALWVDDTKALHGFIRVEISLLLLLSAATATRPGALVESASDRGSNKALCFKDIEVMVVRSVEDLERSTIVANVNLENIKNKDKDEPKKFTFRLESLPAFCIVSHFLAIGVGQKAFKDDFPSIQSIFDLKVPAHRNRLRVGWKDEVLNQPFFCDVKNTTEGARKLKDKAFPYAKYRNIFVRLGRVAGFEMALELYQLRRASGRNINSVLTPAERNRTMGHRGNTYEQYYIPTHITRDFQAIYFGSPSEDVLIESVARMGLSRDRRAPTDLNDDQLEEVRNNPKLVALRNEREECKNQIYDQGFYPVIAAKGTSLYKQYEDIKRKVSSRYQKLHRQRFEKAVRDFHDSVDTTEIARQLSGNATIEVLTLPTVEFEIRERATIAGMLFKPFKNNHARINKRKKTINSFNDTSNNPTHGRMASDRVPQKTQGGETVKLEPDASETDEVEAVQCLHPYPMVLPHPVCLICIGNDEFSYEKRMRPKPRKDVLKKHVETHFQLPEYQKEFECRHPKCSAQLENMVHFKRHAYEIHGVSH